MKFLYQIPSLSTITAGRTYLEGYKNAILDLGHDFRVLTADDDLKVILDKYQPDIFMTTLHSYNLKYLDLNILRKAKKKGMKVFVNVAFWKSPFPKSRINEAPSLCDNKEQIALIKSGKFGDAYYNVCGQGDLRMEGFEKTTGYKHRTLLLAADKILSKKRITNPTNYKSDISFIGTYLPGRRAFMRDHVFPLKAKYDLKLFCQDLTLSDRLLNFSLKVGQYFNIPYLRSFKKNNVSFDQEREILKNSLICLNIHEDYQKTFGDFNDRTFKIPAYGGFQITDNVVNIGNYLKDGEEVVIAKNTIDWFEKIEYYLKNPKKRQRIIDAGRKKVLKYHTYHNRVAELIKIHKSLT